MKKVIGIRPGEKVHEDLITSAESFSTIDIGNFYAILPHPEYHLGRHDSKFPLCKKVPEGFQYNSGTNKKFLSIYELRELIKEHIDEKFKPFRNFYKNSKYIPYGRQNITRDDIKAVVKVLKSEFLTQGNLLEDFEKGISKKVNSKHAIAVNSATSALHIACLALGLKKGDYLWTSPITFVASANCGIILWCQNRFC